MFVKKDYVANNDAYESFSKRDCNKAETPLMQTQSKIVAAFIVKLNLEVCLFILFHIVKTTFYVELQ